MARDFSIEDELLDIQIINFLVRKHLGGWGHGFTSRYIGRKFGVTAIKANAEMRSLQHRALVEPIRASRTRWRATTKAVTRHGFAEGGQRSIEVYL